VTVYVVEHQVPDVDEVHLEALREALREITRRLDGANDGQRIAYLRSTVINGAERCVCVCVFEASSEALVKRVNELAQVPVASIAPATDYDFTRPTSVARPAADEPEEEG
jgi:hypothetical protein